MFLYGSFHNVQWLAKLCNSHVSYAKTEDLHIRIECEWIQWTKLTSFFLNLESKSYVLNINLNHIISQHSMLNTLHLIFLRLILYSQSLFNIEHSIIHLILHSTLNSLYNILHMSCNTCSSLKFYSIIQFLFHHLNVISLEESGPFYFTKSAKLQVYNGIQQQQYLARSNIEKVTLT